MAYYKQLIKNCKLSLAFPAFKQRLSCPLTSSDYYSCYKSISVFKYFPNTVTRSKLAILVE